MSILLLKPQGPLRARETKNVKKPLGKKEQHPSTTFSLYWSYFIIQSPIFVNNRQSKSNYTCIVFYKLQNPGFQNQMIHQEKLELRIFAVKKYLGCSHTLDSGVCYLIKFEVSEHFGRKWPSLSPSVNSLKFQLCNLTSPGTQKLQFAGSF